MKRMLKVSCSFCGREMECPEDMMSSEKHACFKCFSEIRKNPNREDLGRIHVDVPRSEMDDLMPEFLVEKFVEKVFPLLWDDKKSKFKEMSKKEVAKEMFGAGALVFQDALADMKKVAGREMRRAAKENKRG